MASTNQSNQERETFLRELYKLTNGQLRALASLQNVDISHNNSKATLIDACLRFMGYRGVTEPEAIQEQKLADLTPQQTKATTLAQAEALKLSTLYQRVDAAAALLDSEFYLFKSELDRQHPTDSTEHAMLIQTRDEIMRIRKRLREQVKHRWNL